MVTEYSTIGEITGPLVLLDEVDHATFEELVEITRPLAPENYVLHVAGMLEQFSTNELAGTGTPHIRDMLLNNAFQCLEQMSAFVEPKSICVENLHYFPIEFLFNFLKFFNST